MHNEKEIELAKDIYKILIVDCKNVTDFVNYPDGLSHNDEVLYAKGCAKRAILLSKLFYDILNDYDIPMDYMSKKLYKH